MAGKDALKTGMDEIKANVDANPYILAALHLRKILPSC